MGIYNAMLYPQSAPAPKPVSKARVVNDAPVADVDAVVVVEGARGDEVAGEWRLLVGAQKRIAREAPVNGAWMPRAVSVRANMADEVMQPRGQ
jgi:hypothetical protein